MDRFPVFLEDTSKKVIHILLFIPRKILNGTLIGLNYLLLGLLWAALIGVTIYMWAYVLKDEMGRWFVLFLLLIWIGLSLNSRGTLRDRRK